MRGIIIATGSTEHLGCLAQGQPSPLLKVMDKPMLYHVVDWCVDRGLTSLVVLLHHQPELIQSKLGDGSRWGLPISYFLCKDPSRPLSPLRGRSDLWKKEQLILGRGDQLPMNVWQQDPEGARALYCPELGWTGWATLPGKDLEELIDQEAEAGQLHPLPNWQIEQADFLSACSIGQLARANQRFLEEDTLPLHPPTTVREIEKGIWVSANSQIHPQAQIEGPVFIGRNSQIREDVYVGPGTVIESNCIIDHGTSLRSTLVRQNTYVGEHLSLNDSIVDRKWIMHVERGSHLSIADDVILCDLSAPSFTDRAFQLLERLAALGTLLFLLPLLPILLFFLKPQKQSFVAIPSTWDPQLWTTKSLYSLKWRFGSGSVPSPLARLPQVWNLVKGDLHWLGLRPRSVEDIHALPFDWRELYLRCKAGLIHAEDIDFPSGCTEDERYIAEVYYSAHQSPSYDLRSLAKFVRNCLF